MNDLQKLFSGELQEIYDAEHQLEKTLQTLAQKAEMDELKRAFQQHLEQTRNQIRRLERVFQILGESPRRRSCKGMEGIIDGGEIVAKEYARNTALDAALICAAQKTEHYEITAYGCLCTWAEELQLPEALALLKENLSEEKETDQRLTELAETRSNLHAIAHDTEKSGEFSAIASKMATSGP